MDLGVVMGTSRGGRGARGGTCGPHVWGSLGKRGGLFSGYSHTPAHSTQLCNEWMTERTVLTTLGS